MDDQPVTRWTSAHADHVAETMSTELARVGIHLGGARLDRVAKIVARSSLDWVTGLINRDDTADE